MASEAVRRLDGGAGDDSPRGRGPGARAFTGSPGIPYGRLVPGAVAFLLLTVAIFWYQFSQIQSGDEIPRWDRLQWRYLGLILLCLPLESVASAARIWLLARVLEPGLTPWTCLKAEWANAAISILTPSQTGGGPGQIYMLNRGGASVGTALTISLLSFVGTMVGLFGMGLYTLLISGTGATGPLFAAAVWMLTVISAAMLAAAAWPAFFRTVLARLSRAYWRLRSQPGRLHDWSPPGQAGSGPAVDRMGPVAGRLADVLYTYRNDVRRFLRVGKASFVGVCLLSLVFLFARALMPYLCVRFLGVEASTFGRILEAQIALIFLVFFAPTPGGAGVAESASLSIMQEIVPGGVAPYYNLLWRFATAYLAAIAGLFCVGQALVQDARGVVRRRTSPRRSPEEGR